MMTDTTLITLKEIEDFYKEYEIIATFDSKQTQPSAFDDIPLVFGDSVSSIKEGALPSS